MASNSAEDEPDRVTAASPITLGADEPATAPNTRGYSGIHLATTPVAALRHGGTIRRAVIVVHELAPRSAGRWTNRLRGALGPETEITEVRVRHFEGAEAAARGAAAWGADLVVAVGGDGTVNACINGIKDSRTRIAVIPAGTANDVARLGGSDVRRHLDTDTLADWRTRDIDAISSNGHRFYAAGGLGWVAEVAAAANRWRAGSWFKRWFLARIGSLIYTLACITVIFGSRRLGARYRIRYVDGVSGREKEIDTEAWGVVVANTPRIGKAFHLAPVSEVDDGVFEMVVFEKRTRWRLLKASLMAQRGRMFELPEVYWVQARSAEIVTSRQQRFFGDGETLEHNTRFDVDLEDAAVHMLAPVTATEEVGERRLAPLAR